MDAGILWRERRMRYQLRSRAKCLYARGGGGLLGLALGEHLRDPETKETDSDEADHDEDGGRALVLLDPVGALGKREGGINGGHFEGG